jgi:hypothetical protein
MSGSAIARSAIWLLRVHLTERALCLNDCASDARFRLSQCASKPVLYCAPGRSSLRADAGPGAAALALVVDTAK